MSKQNVDCIVKYKVRTNTETVDLRNILKLFGSCAESVFKFTVVYCCLR